VQLEIPEAYAPPAEVRHKWFEIVRGANGWVLTIRKGYAWDGATHASDFSPGGTVRRVMDLLAAGDIAGAVAMAAPLIGSTAHDPLYQFLTYLAKVWGQKESEVREWADLLFRALMEAAGARGQARRYFWAVRILGGVYRWWNRPRERISLNPLRWFAGLLVAGCILCQGCATSAWHNYQVAEAEASERAQLEAGLIPLVKTNGDIVRENWFGYVVGVALDAGAAYCIYKYVERDDRQPKNETYYTTITYPADPAPEGGE
jgi:hypothetical protein